LTTNFEVVIVGGGLAGLTAAIHLSKEKHSVLVIEKKTYPHHKVCGEYVSNEITPYLESLGVSLSSSNALAIDTLTLSTVKGKSIQTKLPLGGVGISRYGFDHLLYQKALKNKVQFVFETVKDIHFDDELFEVRTENEKIFEAKIVIGAYGKRSSIDKQLKRSFINKKSAWLGVKAHYELASFPNNHVALHNFNGGYGGLSKTETGAVNFCYLASYESFQKEKNVASFNENVVAENPFLNQFLEKAKPVFKEALSIAQISFEQKKSVENHIIMCGDTAGLIYPLCGNGMAMAIHSAKIASEIIHDFLSNRQLSRIELEQNYTRAWKNTFKKRLWMGRQLQTLMTYEKLSNLALHTVTASPSILKRLIKTTHGKPVLC